MPSARKLAQQRGETLFLRQAQPGGGLVQQQQARAQAQARGRSPPRAAGPAADRRPACPARRPSPTRTACVRASASSRASSARSSRSIARSKPARPDRCVPSAMFSSTLRAGSSFTCWKVRARPSAATRRGGRCAAGAPNSADVAGTGRQHAADQVEQRRLAGAVRADQRDDLAGVHGEADVAVRRQAAEVARDRLQREQFRAWRRRAGRVRRRDIGRRRRFDRGSRRAAALQPREQRQQAVGRALQQHDHDQAEHQQPRNRRPAR